MENMRLYIAGKNNIAVEGLLMALELREKYRFDIGVICNKTETGVNGWQRSLRWYAQKFGVKEYKLEDIYDIEDSVFLSLEYDSIVDVKKFKTKRLYNIHYSMLPYYKGMYTSAIPLLNGESSSGVTLHCLDAGIDTGNIIAHKKFKIEKDDTCRDLYFKYTTNAIELLKDNIEMLIIEKNISGYEQLPSEGSYYSRKYLDYNNMTVDLRQVSINIYNQLRAFNFREYQLPEVFNRKVISARITKMRSAAKYGTILMENEIGCMIATIDYNLIIYWDRFEQLMNACKTGDLDMVSQICTVKEHINQAGCHGWTPLMVATYHGYYDIVRYLIINGADIYATNYNGTNLLMYAKAYYVNSGDAGMFELYYNMGLKLEQTDYTGYDLRYYCQMEGIDKIGEIIMT